MKPPPASPPPFPPRPTTVSIDFTLQATLASFDEAAQLTFRQGLAAQLDGTVTASDITLAIAAGSIVVTATIATEDEIAAAAVESRLLSESFLADLSAATGQSVTSVSVPVVGTLALTADSPNETGGSAGSGGLGGVIGGAVGGVAALLLLVGLACYVRRRKPSDLTARPTTAVPTLASQASHSAAAQQEAHAAGDIALDVEPDVGKKADKETAEKAASEAASMLARAEEFGLLDPLKVAKADDPATVAAAVAYCDKQGASGVGDLVEYSLWDGLLESLNLKPVPAKKLRVAVEKAAALKSARRRHQHAVQQPSLPSLPSAACSPSAASSPSAAASSRAFKPYDIFVSFRFAEAEAEANALKAALEAEGYKTFVSHETPGSDLQEAIGVAIGESRLQVLLATKTYGKKTNQQYSTYQEMNYAVNHHPFLIRMPWDVAWTEPVTSLALEGRMWEPWTPGAPIPDGLVDRIIAKADGLPPSP